MYNKSALVWHAVIAGLPLRTKQQNITFNWTFRSQTDLDECITACGSHCRPVATDATAWWRYHTALVTPLPYRRKHVHFAASRLSFFSFHRHPRALASLPDNSSDGGARSIGCGGHDGRSDSGSISDPGPLSSSQPGLGASIHGSVSHGGRLPAAALLPRPGLREVPRLSPVWPRTDDPRRGGF